MFRVEGINVGKFYGKTAVFRNLHFRFESSGVIGIRGPNGSGKSTLLKCLSGLLRPTEGSLLWSWNGKELPMRFIRFHIGFAAPYIQLYHDMTVAENLEFLCRARGRSPLHSERANRQTHCSGLVKMLLQRFALNELSSRSFGRLSSGQQQRVKLAAALAGEPEILMLDEPGTNLDQQGLLLVAETVRLHRQQGGLTLLASNREEELALCQQFISLEQPHPPATDSNS